MDPVVHFEGSNRMDPAVHSTLTKKGVATRERIVAGTAELVRERGADKVGLDDVRALTATSKSQLFHYFPDGRAALLRAVAGHEADAVIADQQPYLGELDGPASWQAWRDVVVAKYRAQGDACPLSALTQQLVPGDSAIKPIIAELLRHWHALLASGVQRAQAAGRVDAAADPAQLASTILAAVQGGVVLMQATGSVAHLEQALDAALRAAGVL
jgi:AcrR family transcriptional regulator